MVAWAVKNPGGMVPKTESRLLPDNMAEAAVNCDLASAAFDGLPSPELVHDFSAVLTTVKRGYRFPDPAGLGADAWLALPSQYSSVVRSPLANDPNKRIYWTNPGEISPHWDSYVNILASSPPQDLGITQPTTAPTVGAVGGTADTVSRSYLYTFVNAFGEESAPSSPSAVVSAPSDAVWTISAIPATAPNPVGRAYPLVTLVNVYRTLTGRNTGGQFFLINQFNLGAVTSFVDGSSDAAAANNLILASSGWGNPPDYLDGLTALPGGFLAGFVGNTIYFCEPDRPHAWPAAYAQSLEYVIVGLGVWQQSLVVLTTGFPSTGTGSTPANFVFQTVRVPEPCISRGSIITDLMGVYYASQNGLVMLNYYGMQNQTLSAVTKNIWLNDYAARTIVACRHRAQYLAIRNNGSGTGFIIDYSEARLGFTDTNSFNGALCVWNDEYSGDAYIMSADKKVYRWDSSTTPPMTYRWRSKQFYSPAPISLGACQISVDEAILSPPAGGSVALDNGDPSIVLPTGVAAIFRLYVGADGLTQVYQRNLTRPQEIFRLPSGVKDFIWQFEIVARVRIFSVELATTMKELKGV